MKVSIWIDRIVTDDGASEGVRGFTISLRASLDRSLARGAVDMREGSVPAPRPRKIASESVDCPASPRGGGGAEVGNALCDHLLGGRR